MQTVKKLAEGIKSIPADIAWKLAGIAEAKGRHEYFGNRSLKNRKVLHEQALIESTISSNRMDGFRIDKNRIGVIIPGPVQFKDRFEEEIKGYCDASELVNDYAVELTFSQSTIKKLHKMIRGQTKGAGQYKKKDINIIEQSPDGKTQVRFKTVPSSNTPSAMKEFISCRKQLMRDRNIHPIIIAAASCLDFLCIHPFQEGNGRVSRLLLLLQLFHEGYDAGKYISLEKIFEKHKRSYYKSLEQSTQNWNKSKHDPWPFIRFVLEILNKAYLMLTERGKGEKTEKSKGDKTELVLAAIRKLKVDFTLSQLLDNCPEVNTEMVRKVLDGLQREGNITLIGKGSGVRWLKKGHMLM